MLHLGRPDWPDYRLIKRLAVSSLNLMETGPKFCTAEERAAGPCLTRFRSRRVLAQFYWPGAGAGARPTVVRRFKPEECRAVGANP